MYFERKYPTLRSIVHYGAEDFAIELQVFVLFRCQKEEQKYWAIMPLCRRNKVEIGNSVLNIVLRLAFCACFCAASAF